MKHIRTNLKVLMAQKGVNSLAELHRQIQLIGRHMNRRTLYKVYHDEGTRIDYYTIESLCTVLDCGIEELLILEQQKGEE